jgi:hypothetical protein
MPLHPGLLRCCTVRHYCSSCGQLDRTPWTLKLKSLQDGPFDEKFGEYEWLHKATPSLSTTPPQPSLPRPHSPNPPVVLHLADSIPEAHTSCPMQAKGALAGRKRWIRRGGGFSSSWIVALLSELLRRCGQVRGLVCRTLLVCRLVKAGPGSYHLPQPEVTQPEGAKKLFLTFTLIPGRFQVPVDSPLSEYSEPHGMLFGRGHSPCLHRTW